MRINKKNPTTDYKSTLATHVQKCPRVHPRLTNPRLRFAVVRRVKCFFLNTRIRLLYAYIVWPLRLKTMDDTESKARRFHPFDFLTREEEQKSGEILRFWVL